MWHAKRESGRISPTSTTLGRSFQAAASIRVRLMCNLSSKKVRLLIKCGFYTQLYGKPLLNRGRTKNWKIAHKPRLLYTVFTVILHAKSLALQMIGILTTPNTAHTHPPTHTPQFLCSRYVMWSPQTKPGGVFLARHCLPVPPRRLILLPFWPIIGRCLLRSKRQGKRKERERWHNISKEKPKLPTNIAQQDGHWTRWNHATTVAAGWWKTVGCHRWLLTDLRRWERMCFRRPGIFEHCVLQSWEGERKKCCQPCNSANERGEVVIEPASPSQLNCLRIWCSDHVHPPPQKKRRASLFLDSWSTTQ